MLKNHLLTTREEHSLLESLNSDKYQGDVDFIKFMYATKLQKYNMFSSAQVDQRRLQLAKTYNVENSSLVMLAIAEKLMNQCDYRQAKSIIQKLSIFNDRIYQEDSHNLECITLYIVCLNELEDSNELFRISHLLVDLYPLNAVPWFGVATYYLCIGNYQDARTYFSKATAIDPSFGSAWIGFAHSFSLEEEHDQALAAYSTAARLLQG